MSDKYGFSSSSFASASYSSSSTSSTNNHDRGHSQRYTETMSSNDRDGTTVRRTHEETGKPTLDETYHSPPTRNRGAARITDDDNAASDQGRIQDVTDVDVDPSDQEEKDRQYLESMEDEYAKREGCA
ncbi:uncharacterized protein PV06_01159 [Exophiala oligosperma]|uniref:Uncharacterized protein n=1 Tax=Exophiala oligosperma TaxID=215243 RepID=A0A0D2CFF2_9EURO|nr:uncharacterized protein PV06_01159 [Exophiala oligosperma]KIW48587.1 hypothetical protein PV06_01159 [Exophiala oligosperma]